MAHTGTSIILTLAALLVLVNGKRYDPPPGYVFTNNASLENSTDDRASYRIISGENNEQIVSGDFTLAFHDPNNTGDYFLSVLLTPGGAKNKSASLAVPIWVANYNSSVKDGATLMYTRNHQKLILLDGGSAGTLKWNPGATEIQGIELTETGNLRLYDDQGKVLWESFQHPTSVLVPGQALGTGASLFSSSSNSSMMGEFHGVVEANGFVLYVVSKSQVTMANILRTPQPYQVWSVGSSSSSSSKLESAKHVCGTSPAMLKFIRNRISVNSPSCGSGEAVVFERTAQGGESPQYMELEENGDLVVYEFDGRGWTTVFNLSEKATGACKLPTECGSYGFCSKQGECKCVEDGSELETRKICTPPSTGLSGSCLTNEAENHHFFKVEGATYFSNRFTKPDKEKISQEDCLSLCRANCSCAAAFYSGESRRCFLVEELTGSMTVEPDQPDSTGFVKFQNSEVISEPLRSRARGVTRSARTAIIFLAVLVVLLALALVGVIWIVKTKFPHAYDRVMRRK